MSHRDNTSSHPPPSAYAWPPPPWLTIGTLLPGQEAVYAGHQPLLEANGCPFPSHSYPPPPPPHLQPAATADMPSPPWGLGMSAVALPSHPQPKPHPIFGHASASDNENSLPAPTLASILVDMKPGAMAASEVVSGKWAGCGMKAVKVKQGVGKRRLRVGSELGDGAVKRKGKIWGAVNWADQDFAALLDIVEELLLAGKKAQGQVYSHFEAWAKEHGHLVHSESMLENRFKVVSLLF